MSKQNILDNWENELEKWIDKCPEALPDFVWDKNWDYLLEFIEKLLKAKDEEVLKKAHRVVKELEKVHKEQMREAIEEAWLMGEEGLHWTEKDLQNLFKEYNCEEEKK